MRNKLCLSLLGASILSVGCQKEPAVDVGCGAIQGITYMDMSASPFYATDSTDWGLVDEWCPWVDALFEGRPDGPLHTDVPGSLGIFTFPNPSPWTRMLVMQHEAGTSVDLRVVNKYHVVLYSRDGITAAAIQIGGDSIVQEEGELLRIYYRFNHADGTVHQGHGDIKRGPVQSG